MYYKLADRYVLRGWELLPYAVCDTKTKQVSFMRKPQYQALMMCNGKIDMDGCLGTEQNRYWIDLFLEEGIICPCSRGDDLSEEQKYHKYDSRFIKTAQWSVTGRCNFKCRHCFMSAPHAKMGELPLKDCLKIVDELARCGINNVSLTGGEALIRKDFFEIVDALLEKGIAISGLYSNGKLVTPTVLDELEKRGQKPVIHMSFDGVGWHDWLRGIDGAEKYVTDAYRLCQKRGFATTAEMCLHKRNKDTLRETVQFLASLGVMSLKAGPVVPMGDWVEEALQYTLSTEEAFEIYLDYLPHFYEDQMPIALSLEGFFASEKGSKKYQIPNMKYPSDCDCQNKSICGHARNSLYISPDGTALPCMPLAGSSIQGQFPNILKTGLSQILSDSFYMKMVDIRLKDYLEHNKECQTCEYQNACGGGCRGFAIGSDTEDYLTIDQKTCTFFKKQYPERIKRVVEAAQKNYLD